MTSRRCKCRLDLQVTPVFRAGRELPATLPARLLFEGPVSGTGETTDWSAAARLATRTQLILAGGLKPANVAEAIAAAQAVRRRRQQWRRGAARREGSTEDL